MKVILLSKNKQKFFEDIIVILVVLVHVIGISTCDKFFEDMSLC